MVGGSRFVSSPDSATAINDEGIVQRHFVNVACWRNSFIMDPVLSYDAGFNPLFFVYKRLLA